MPLIADMLKQGSAADLKRARQDTDVDPSPAQIEAGNYAKGRLRFHGLPIVIENPKRSYRRGVDPDGRPWKRMLHADYGYISGTEAVDGDQVDVFLGPDLGSELVVAVDQYDGDRFDETKFILGCHSKEEGRKLYARHYPPDWEIGPTTTATVWQLRDWLKSGQVKKPFAGQQVKAAAEEDPGSFWSRWLATSASGLLTSAPGAAYAKGAIPRITPSHTSDARNRDLFNRLLRDHTGDTRVNISPGGKDNYDPRHNVVDLKGEGARTSGGRDIHRTFAGGRMSADARTNPSAGLLAHELGHARSPKMTKLNLLGKNVAGLSMLPILLSGNEDVSAAAAGVGTAGMVGTLASEVDASRRGYRMMRGAGSGRTRALTSLVGLPTYLLAAASPTLAHKLSGKFGGHDRVDY